MALLQSTILKSVYCHVGDRRYFLPNKAHRNCLASELAGKHTMHLQCFGFASNFPAYSIILSASPVKECFNKAVNLSKADVNKLKISLKNGGHIKMHALSFLIDRAIPCIQNSGSVNIWTSLPLGRCVKPGRAERRRNRK